MLAAPVSPFLMLSGPALAAERLNPMPLLAQVLRSEADIAKRSEKELPVQAAIPSTYICTCETRGMRANRDRNLGIRVRLHLSTHPAHAFVCTHSHMHVRVLCGRASLH